MTPHHALTSPPLAGGSTLPGRPRAADTTARSAGGRVRCAGSDLVTYCRPIMLPLRLSPLLLSLSLAALPGCAPGEESSAPSASSPGPTPPHVVLILLDTLRADALSFYGHDRTSAPYLASLAANGTIFQRAYSSSTWTAPATATVHTGVYPDRHGVTRGFLAQFREVDAVPEADLGQMQLLAISSTIPTLAERFATLGYRTWGLTTNVNVGSEMAFDRGFERFERHDLRTSRFIRERLITWRDEAAAANDTRPLFLYLHLNDVHKPYHLRPQYYIPEEGRDETAELRARYQSELGFVDGVLSRIHADLSLTDDTLLVMVADHGDEFGEHGGQYHEFTLYNELNQVPMLFHAPALRVRPGVVQENVGLIDVAPTLLDLLGIDVPEDLDGRSLASFCRSPDKRTGLGEERQALIERPLILHRFEDGVHLWGIIQEQWKLIEGPQSLELYHLGRDPLEQTNVVQRFPELAAQLRARLSTHRERGADPHSARTEVQIDAELLERLKSLGYVK